MSSFYEKAGARVFSGCRVLLAAAKGDIAAASATKSTTKSSYSARGGYRLSFGLIMKMPVSPALGSFLGGASESNRCGTIKQIWAHIKLHGLQCPDNKREIICDDKLKTIFGGREKVGMMEMTKLLSPHFLKKEAK